MVAMALFRKKRLETPKSPLGLALYHYDIILNKDLGKILSRIKAKKKLNAKKAGIIIENVTNKFDDILLELSKEKLKVDYRSDKIRYKIIDMINKLKDLLKKAKTGNFNSSEIEKTNNFPEMEEIIEIRNVIRDKMRDIESDYI